MPIDLDLIEATAQKATAGPWENTSSIDGRRTSVRSKDDLLLILATGPDDLDHGRTGTRLANAAHIALLNPQLVLEWVGEMRRLREALEKIAANTYGTEVLNTDEENDAIMAPWAFRYQIIARAALKGQS